MRPSRFLPLCLIALLAAAVTARALPPVQPLTSGPAFHWFGYYDKLQFDPTGRYVLGQEVDFETRSPLPGDVIRPFMIDLQNGNQMTFLGESDAWCWQQGCMLQWRSGSATEVLWNDRDDDAGRFVCHILDTQTMVRRTIPNPIYTLSPDGVTALSVDFARLHDTRPGYGYAGIEDANAAVLAPADAGIYRVDLDTGDKSLLISLAQLAAIPSAQGMSPTAKHWVNHLLFNPDGTRFAFLHRWGSSSSYITRMMTAAADGTDIRVIDDAGSASHYDWRDTTHILAWASRPSNGGKFYFYEDVNGGGSIQVIGSGIMTTNGHCTYLRLPAKDWILNDTYPDAQDKQNPYLYRVSTGTRLPLGSFLSPPAYSGERRCDTHPRSSPDAKKVVIDSPHGGNGRQLYLIDISDLTGGGVDAGAAQAIAFPQNQVTLAGTSTLGLGATFSWSAPAAPAAVTFSNPTALQTTATFTQPGAYQLRLTGTDGITTASDDVTIQVFPEPALSGGLIGYWRFDEGGGTTAFDLSGNSHHATLSGGASYRDESVEGSHALRLDGTGRAETPSTASLSVMGGLTISAWVRATDAAARGIVSKYQGTGNARAYNLQVIGGMPQFVISPDGTFPNAVSVTSATPLPVDAWTHLAAVFSPSDSMRLYRNGQPDASRTMGVPAKIAATAASLWIGLQFDTSSGNFWRGDIDSVRIYDRALSAGEVAQLTGSATPKALPRTVSPRIEGGNFLFDWVPLPGATYTVQRASDMSLAVGAWTDLFGVAGTGAPRTESLPTSGADHFFFRLRLEP